MSSPSPFAGLPASVGTRLAAFTIDAALLGAAATIAAILGSPLLGAAVAFEALLGLWIMQARTGATPGAVFLRVRVTRDDGPFSPGAGRAFVRGSLMLLGALVLVAGAWVVVASAAWDRSGRRRSWLDKAAQTLVIALPAPGGAETYALASPTVMGRSSAQRGRAMSRPADAAPLSPSELPIAPEWGAAVVAPPQAPHSATTGVASPAAAPAAPAAPAPVSPAPVVPLTPPSPAAASARPAASAQTALLLLVFDTGQRAQFSLPVAVNLGRSPVVTEPTDALVSIDDPDRMVSKTHLRLEHDGDTAWVTDAGSTNGSELVDEDGVGRVLAAGVRTVLDDGMRVRVGERVFTLSRLIGGPA